MSPVSDGAAGYLTHAAEFIRRRDRSIGAARVRAWTRSLRRGAHVLELGCGFGEPVSRVLLENGLNLSAIDASLPLVDEFHRRYPAVEVAWERVEESKLFGRQFEGVIAIGLLFLLEPAAQRELFCQVALALEPRGRWLFTAPVQAMTWTDVLTGHDSQSLGAPAYRDLLTETGFELLAEDEDEGDNHYYDCRLT